MASYPTSIPSIAAMVGNLSLQSQGHNSKHELLRTELVAIATKVGADSSADTTTHDYKLSGVTGSDKAVSKTGVETVSNKTFTSSTITSPSVSNGTFSSPSIITPTVSNPTITGGGSWAGSPTITTPTIASFTNSTHNHQNAAGGGQLSAAALTSFDTSLTTISNPYKFFAFQSSVQTLASGTAEKVSFQSEAYDTNNNFSTSTYRYTAPVTGFYAIQVKVGDVLAAAATFQTFVLKNGNNLLGSQASNSNAGTRIVCEDINTIIPLTAGDYLEVFVAGTGGDTICATATYDADAEIFTYFSGFLVSRT